MKKNTIPPLLLLVACLLACAGVPACSGASEVEPSRDGAPTTTDARGVFLQEALAQDNRDLLEREPALTQGKLRKMAATPYNHFRGSAAIYYADLTEPGAARYTTRHGSPDAALVRLVGDPHPENIGTFRGADGRTRVAFNDLDASLYGPFHLDVWRLALGFEVAGHMAGDRLDATQREALRRAVALGYADELRRLRASEPPTRFDHAPGEGRREATPILGDLIRRAERDGDAREELSDYTEIRDGARVMRLGEIEAPVAADIISDELVALSGAQERTARDAIARYPQTIHDLKAAGIDDPRAFFAIKGLARRLGAGVSSYPVLRCYVLVEGPTLALDDDVLLEVKESRDPPRLGGDTPRYGLDRAVQNAARVVSAQRALQGTPDADPLLGWADVGAMSLKVRDRTKYQKGVGLDGMIDDLAAGDLSPDDWIAFAEAAGRLLAQAHTHAPTLHGKPALAAIHDAIGPSTEGFVEEAARFAQRYGARTIEDHTRLAALIERAPMLGYRPNRPME